MPFDAMMTVKLPWEIIYEVIDHFALPKHSLASTLGTANRKALVSLALVCKATSNYATPLLYSTLDIQSVAELGRLARSGTTSLRRVRSLAILLEEAEDEPLKSVISEGILGRALSEFYDTFSRNLTWLLGEVSPNLERLAIGLPTAWGLVYMEVESSRNVQHALERMWAELQTSMAKLIPSLVELVVLGLSLYDDYLPPNFQHEWTSLRRLRLGEQEDELHALGHNAGQFPNLECLQLASDQPSAQNMEGFLRELPCLRRAVVSFWCSEDDRLYLEQVKSRFGSGHPPIDVVLVDLGEKRYEHVPSMIRARLNSGTLWEPESWTTGS